MAKTLEHWLEEDVRPFKDQSVKWLSQHHFFRDPIRPTYSDASLFFSPADGIVLYQETVQPDDSIVEIKGKFYTLRDALRDESFDQPALVIGVFMTFYDVHVNRIPYAGRLSYKELEPIDSFNYPMLDVETNILEELGVGLADFGYLQNNQRVVNKVFSPELHQHYYILQIADYDVDCITPFELKQNQPCSQNQRFSQIRFGSQVDLVIPLSDRYDLETLQETETHVEAGIDPLVRITERSLLL